MASRDVTDGSNDRTDERYREVEFDGTDGPWTIIQDTEHEDRWIQSNVTTEVRR